MYVHDLFCRTEADKEKAAAMADRKSGMPAPINTKQIEQDDYTQENNFTKTMYETVSTIVYYLCI